MNTRTFVTFQWKPREEPKRDPYDSVFILPLGFELLAYLRHSLKQLGYSTTAPYSDYGSDLAFGIESGGVRVCCVVKEGQPCLVATEVQGWSRTTNERRDLLGEQSRVCAALHECLLGSGRATDLNWYSRRDFEHGRVEARADRP